MKNFFIVASFIFIIVLLTGCSNGISKEVNLDKIDINKSKLSYFLGIVSIRNE